MKEFVKGSSWSFPDTVDRAASAQKVEFVYMGSCHTGVVCAGKLCSYSHFI